MSSYKNKRRGKQEAGADASNFGGQNNKSVQMVEESLVESSLEVGEQ